jgi:hypothetical protein
MNDQSISILLVEDDPGAARLLRERLADVGAMRSELAWSAQLGGALWRPEILAQPCWTRR